MRFSKLFMRRKGATPLTIPAIGTDGSPGSTNPPTEPPNSTRDNILAIKPYSNQGWPCHRVAVGYKGLVGAPNLPCEVWGYDHLSAGWYLLDDSKDLVLNRVTYFDVLALIDQAPLNTTLLESASGAVELFIKIQDNALADGVYTFVVGTDLTPLAV